MAAMITIPYITSLKTEDGWSRDPKSEHTYSVFRCHYLLRVHQLDEPMKKGEVITGATAIAGINQEKTYASEYESSTINLEESVKDSLLEEESVTELVSSLSAGIGSDAAGKLSGDLKSSIQAKLRQSFKTSFKVQVSESNREKKAVTWKYSIDTSKFNPSDTVVGVAAYKRYACDLYLVFVDYLFIEYRRPPFGVKLRRSKRPVVEGKKHPNIIKFNLPLASLLYWKLLQDTILLVKEESYKLEVYDPFEVEVRELQTAKIPYAPISPEPTLYDISNQVFPPKRSLWK